MHLAPTTLRGRILALILLAVLPSIGLWVYVALDQRRVASERAEAESLRIAQLFAAHQDLVIDGARLLLVSLAEQPGMRSQDRAILERTFRRVIDGGTHMVFLAAADSTGRVFASTRDGHSPVSIAGTAWFRETVVSRAFTVGAPAEATPYGATLVCAYPVLGRDGETKAVVFGGLTLAELAEALPGIELPRGAVLFLLTRSGRVVARLAGEDVPHGPKEVEPDLYASGEPGQLPLQELRGDDGVVRLFARQPLQRVPERRIMVCYGLPKETIFGEAERTFLKSILAIGLIGILVIHVAIRNARRFVVRPVEELVAATRRLGDRAAEADLEPADAPGEMGELARALHEMTRRIHEEEDALRASETRFRALIEHNTEGMGLLDAQANFRYVSPSVSSILGYTASEVLEKTVPDLIHPNDQARVREAFADLLTRPGGSITAECRVRHKDGTYRWVEGIGSNLLWEPTVEAIVVNFRDITERRRNEQVLRTMTLIDELTGLYNRRGFLAFAEQQVRTAERTGSSLWLLFADLDGLKKINDTHGHSEGDQALVDTAMILQRTFRESDVIGRIGGDEFSVLAVETAPAGVATMVDRLNEQIERHNQMANRPYKLSVSVGSARYDPLHPRTLEELLAEGDALMYERKRARRSA
jgi:diguanylate cyclase (GGDEF)-like protein/PAS domain S-box-containing protein